MLARQHDAAVDPAQVVVMIPARLFRPLPRASQDERRAMPGDGDAGLELGSILRMDLRAAIERCIGNSSFVSSRPSW